MGTIPEFALLTPDSNMPLTYSLSEDCGPIPREEIESICSPEQEEGTKGFKFIRTAYRVKDPKRSIQFYNYLGMSLLTILDVPDFKETIYCMGIVDSSESVPVMGTHERDYWAMTRSGTLELSYHWGTEYDPAFTYDLGNGNRNITIMVPDVRKATERLQKLGVVFSKTPDEGNLRGVAFFVDPDGYVIEMHDSQAVHANV